MMVRAGLIYGGACVREQPGRLELRKAATPLVVDVLLAVDVREQSAPVEQRGHTGRCDRATRRSRRAPDSVAGVPKHAIAHQGAALPRRPTFTNAWAHTFCGEVDAKAVERAGNVSRGQDVVAELLKHGVLPFADVVGGAAPGAFDGVAVVERAEPGCRAQGASPRCRLAGMDQQQWIGPVIAAVITAGVSVGLGRGGTEARLLRRASGALDLAGKVRSSATRRSLHESAEADIGRALVLRATGRSIWSLVITALVSTTLVGLIPWYVVANPRVQSSSWEPMFWLVLWIVYGVLSIALWVAVGRVSWKRARAFDA